MLRMRIVTEISRTGLDSQHHEESLAIGGRWDEELHSNCTVNGRNERALNGIGRFRVECRIIQNNTLACFL